MSKNYIRVYCNDTKIRSTGGEKWYRDMVLQELGLNGPVNTHKVYPILKSMIYNVDNYKTTDKFVFTVEFVKSNKRGKEVVKTATSPFKIIRMTDTFRTFMPDELKNQEFLLYSEID